jgi:hypothetical protein
MSAIVSRSGHPKVQFCGDFSRSSNPRLGNMPHDSCPPDCIVHFIRPALAAAQIVH